MNRIASTLRRLGVFWTGALLLCGFAAVALAQQAPAVIGTITGEGKVTVTSQGMTYEVEPGESYPLYADDIIVTEEDGWAYVTVNDTERDTAYLCVAPESLVSILDPLFGNLAYGRALYRLFEDVGFELLTPFSVLKPVLSDAQQTRQLAEGVIDTAQPDVGTYILSLEGSIEALVGDAQALREQILQAGQSLYVGPLPDGRVDVVVQEQFRSEPVVTTESCSIGAGILPITTVVVPLMATINPLIPVGVIAGGGAIAIITADDDDEPASPVMPPQ